MRNMETPAPGMPDSSTLHAPRVPRAQRVTTFITAERVTGRNWKHPEAGDAGEDPTPIPLDLATAKGRSPNPRAWTL